MRWLFNVFGWGAEPAIDTSLLQRVGAPAEVERHPDWKLALSLVDREKHGDAVTERLLRLNRSGTSRPLLVIVPGYNLDRHWSLVMRCARWDLRQKTGKDWEFLDEVKWPRSDLAHVLREVGERLEVANATKDTLAAHFASQGRSLCLAHYIWSKDWANDGGKSLQQWVKLFEEGGLRTHPDRFVVAFLCVEYWTKYDKEDRPLRDACEEWSTKYAREDSAILVRPSLELVELGHLRAWRHEASRKLGITMDPLETEINELFRDEPEMHMARVHSRLEEPLKQILARPRPEIVRSR
jgi:hypothetical protein